MLKIFKTIERTFLRLRYPVSLPEEIAEALGVSFSNYLSFKDFLAVLSEPLSAPKRLSRFMPRATAENVFCNAARTERFSERTLVSYHFPEGWVEFILQFDRESRLRRVYLLHREIASDQGIELSLSEV
jgi:hypothetical protein